MQNDDITEFRGEYSFLSNFYPCTIKYPSEEQPIWTFKNAEALFQACKLKYPEHIKSLNFENLTGQEAKRLGRQIQIVNNWDTIKEEVMHEVCRLKFTQNPELRDKLLATGTAQLIEGNYWNDKEWGVSNGEGENKLGKILMRLRSELAAQQNNSQEVEHLDHEALNATLRLIKTVEGLALFQSDESEKYIILDEIYDVEELRPDEYYIRDSAYDKYADMLDRKEELFISDLEQADTLFEQRVEERLATETQQDKLYREYLFELRDEIGESDYLDYAMPREAYFAGKVIEEEPAKESLPVEDIHKTYKNNRAYEKTLPYNLRSRQQFVCWKYEWGGDKWKKVPYNPNTGTKASSVSYKTWSDFETACKAVDKYNFDGVGIMFARGLMGIDVDHCIDENGKISDSAREIIETVNSYTELSPSGTGIHILAFGELPGARSRTGDYEMYNKGRFFTLTGNLFEGKFRKIPKAAETQAAINLMWDKYINVKKNLIDTPKPVSDTPLTYSDDKVLELCRKSRNAAKFNSLWKGDTNLHQNNHSLADNALIGMIAYYSDDFYQIDRIFRQSGLMRPKWDEKHGDKTYGAITIDNILSDGARPRYNPKYFYETHIKPKFQNQSNPEAFTVLKLGKDNYVQDYPRCINFKITKGELAGAIFFYPKSLITETDGGYNLKVKNSFTFKVRPKNSSSDIELTSLELRSALNGKTLNKSSSTSDNKSQNQTKQEQFE